MRQRVSYSAGARTGCPDLAANYALRCTGSKKRIPLELMHATAMFSPDTLALLVPIVLLVVAIRRNTGVLAALILLILFIVKP